MTEVSANSDGSPPATLDAPISEVTLDVERRRPRWDERAMALLEIALCSDLPSQLLLALLFARLGLTPLGTDGVWRIGFFAPLLLLDTVLLVGLVLIFLRTHGESPRDVFFGQRPWWPELRAAVPLTAKAYAILLPVMLTVSVLAPWLHTVVRNPLQDLLLAPGGAALFAPIAILAGGVREEVQRAFILRRFDGVFGRARPGLVIWSLLFGLGHLAQGADAAVATALLGALWGVAYLRRQSIVAPVVSHAAFDLLQVAFFLAAGASPVAGTT